MVHSEVAWVLVSSGIQCILSSRLSFRFSEMLQNFKCFQNIRCFLSWSLFNSNNKNCYCLSNCNFNFFTSSKLQLADLFIIFSRYLMSSASFVPTCFYLSVIPPAISPAWYKFCPIRELLTLDFAETVLQSSINKGEKEIEEKKTFLT